MTFRTLNFVLATALFFGTAGAARGQETPPVPDPMHHDHQMTSGGWTWMSDGVLFITANRQGGDRGKSEWRAQNWAMGMGAHALGPGRLSLSGMISAEPLTLTKAGYSQLFQMGEAYRGLENIDRQHPHELVSQLTAVWRVPVRSGGLTVGGGPVGEATLGPVAFMHRASASDNPTAPLGHHTFDSTHIVQGVVGLGLDRGPWMAEGSVFRGREPDEDRYDIDAGALDSWAARLWFRPSAAWSAQVSHGFLKAPERLEPGDIRRTTASISWQRERGSRVAGFTVLAGHNKRRYTDLAAFLSEGTLPLGRQAVYGRAEVLQVETEHLLFPTVVHTPHPGELVDRLGAYTVGGIRDLLAGRPLNVSIGGDVTFYSVPDRLRPFYGSKPVSIHVYARLRPRAGAMGRMADMTMLRPMAEQ
jgi:hypothetical protein